MLLIDSPNSHQKIVLAQPFAFCKARHRDSAKIRDEAMAALCRATPDSR